MRRLPSCGKYDPEIWFPISANELNSIVVAKAVCGECPLKAACLKWALDNGIRFGTWGGYTEWERTGMRSPRGADDLVEAMASR